MKAWFWHGARDLRLQETALRPLQRGEVRIEVAYCGICGSDLHEYADGPHSIPVAQPHPLSGRQAPLIIGHEFCGTVLETAADVTTLRPGARVTIEPEYRCGHCTHCLAGDYNLCVSMGFAGLMGDGGMAQQAVVPAYMAHELPNEVPFEQAAVAEPAAVALHAVRRSRLRPGDTCVIFGLGAIGQLLVMMARLQGAGQIIAVDVVPARLALARQLGADLTLDARHDYVRAVVLAHTDGAGAPVSFEAAGSQATFDGALQVLCKGGEMVLVGLVPQVRLDSFDLVNRELSITSSVGYRGVYPDLLAWIAEGRLDLSQVVTRIVALEDAVTDGFEAQLQSRDEIKILVRPCG